MLFNFIRDGGFGMIPTLLFGFVLVVWSFLYMLRPERRNLLPVATLGALTFGSGVLGTATGLIATTRYIQKLPLDEQVVTQALGIAESLNNMVLAGILFVLAMIFATIGAFRARRLPASPTPG